ncbi:MAG TPA: S1C family serine protease [Bryobacteraceae bacterium]|nr:S1C family serine protease [Bryobacteraceae bacterium]
MENLSNFSTNLADLVERASQSAVAIEARHRMGSSGFLWKPGFIVTADHAIRREEDIPVILPGGNRVSAAIAGRDPDTDIAVLRIDGSIPVPALATSGSLRTGEIVVAIGRHEPGPLAAMGIVSTASGPWKTWRGGHLDSLLRLDLGAWPRSSGSVVVDVQGRFAGMLTTGLTRTAPVAIPAATIARVATELAERGHVARGYLGISLQPIPLPAAYEKTLNRSQRSGVMVLTTEPEGPAETGGILVGDIVVEIGGQPVTDTDDMQTSLRGAIGKELPVIVLRGGQRMELRVKVGERKK